MKYREMEAIAKGIAPAVKQFVERELDPLRRELAEAREEIENLKRMIGADDA